MSQQTERLWSDRTIKTEARLDRLEIGVNRLVELTERREARFRQQRDRELLAIAGLRARFDSGTPERGFSESVE